MKRIALVALLLASAFASAAESQTSQTSASSIVPVRVSAGSVLTFYLHARLNPTSGDSLDGLPKGTLLRVKMLESIDSAKDADGTEFRGMVVSGLTSSGELVIHPESEVKGILALLRSSSHPEGFRYELLITSLTDHGKSYALTASLAPSLADSQVASNPKPAAKDNPKASESGVTH